MNQAIMNSVSLRISSQQLCWFSLDLIMNMCDLAVGRVSLRMCRQPVIHRHCKGVSGSDETSFLRCVQARFLHR